MPKTILRPEQQKETPKIQTSCKPRFWNAEDPNPRAKVTRVYGVNKGSLQQIGEFYYKDDADYAMHASSNHQDLFEALKCLTDAVEDKHFGEIQGALVKAERALARAKGKEK